MTACQIEGNRILDLGTPVIHMRGMVMLRWVNLVLAALATMAPLAHVLELPNKLALNGPLWLAVQQQLYRGWGPAVGAPTEIGALLTTLALVALRRRRPGERGPLAVAAAGYAGMLAVFFVFNDPVNAALNGWTASTLPADWPAYRLRWETGHAIATALAVAALVLIVRAFLRAWPTMK